VNLNTKRKEASRKARQEAKRLRKLERRQIKRETEQLSSSRGGNNDLQTEGAIREQAD